MPSTRNISEQVEIGPQRRNASFVPASYVEADNSIEVVFATGYRVRRFNWRDEQWYDEVLEITEDAIDLSRLNQGAPVVDSHNTWSIRGVIGVVEKAWIDSQAGEARARIRLSTREDLAGVINDIKAGIIRNVSVGYRVHEYTVDKDTSTWTATRWEPQELSFAPVPADPNSGSRSEGATYPTTINSNSMPQENNQGSAAPATAPEVPAAEQRSAAPVPGTPTTTPNLDQIRQDAIEAERARVSAITDSCRRAGLPEDFGARLVSEGTPLDEARAAIIDEIANRSNPAPVTRAEVTGEDEADQIRDAIIDGITFRANPESGVDISGNERARRYANLRMVDIARDRLRARGERTELLSEQETIRRAWATTDYPDLLTATFDRNLRRVYQGHVDDWRWAARQESASDFRAKTGLTVDGNVTFEEIPENGTYREVPILMNERQAIKLRKYGRMYSISDVALINDDLSVFSRLPEMVAIGAQQFQSEAVWGLVINNAKAPDNKALFHTDHANLASGSGAAISENTLSAARTAMRRQKSPAGHKLGIRPKYLLVPPELETTAEKMVSSVLASQTSDVNVFANRLEVRVSDALVDAKAWYVVADPRTTMVDGLVYAYLSGHTGLKTESRVNWETDALQVKSHMAFAAAVWGWQGWYKNPGGA